MHFNGASSVKVGLVAEITAPFDTGCPKNIDALEYTAWTILIYYGKCLVV